MASPPPRAFAAERRVGRDALHGAVLAVVWVLVPVMWWRVLGRTPTDLLVLAGVFVGASLLVNVSATTLWVEHNLRIFIAKGPRTGASTTPIVYEADWVGRSVAADWAALAEADRIVVSTDGAAKAFTPVPFTPVPVSSDHPRVPVAAA